MFIYRNVAAVLAASGVFQVTIGVLAVAMPLAMDAAGWTALAIGSVAAAYGAGFLAGAYVSPRLIQRVGHIRTFAAMAGLAAALTLMLALSTDFIWWTAARFGFGLCAAALFAVAESWIADATPPENRGSVIAAYQVLGRAGIILGPFLIALPGIDLVDSFIIGGVFLCLGLVPITATARSQPALPEGERASPMRLFEIAPAAALAAFSAGFVNTGVLAFIPLWASRLAPADAGAAALVMAAIYGLSMLVQWPAGRISDGLDRRLVIAALAGFGAAAAIVLAVIPSPPLLIGALLAGAWGAGALTYYGVAVAHAADRSRAEELPAIASGLLMVFALGSILGPIVTGIVYGGPLEGRGLFLYAALGEIILAGLMIWRARARAPVAEAEREPFVNLQTTSAELAEIDAPELVE